MAASSKGIGRAPRKPILLQAVLLWTRCLALPLRLMGRHLHSRMGAPPERYSERLGQPSQGCDSPVIWFHAASLGEVAQIRPLVEALQQANGTKILVTTMSASGADWVASNMPNVIHQFVPLDIPSAVRRFFASWSIEAGIFVEADLWPRLVLTAQRHGIPLLLLNARHSNTRDRFPSTYLTLLSGFKGITCRSKQVADGFRAIGINPHLLQVLPDLRITASGKRSSDDKSDLADQIGGRTVWLAASTHRQDEDAVLAAHKRLLADDPDALLIIAPRYPRRSSQLFSNACQSGLEVARRSTQDALLPSTQVYLADTLGELALFFGIASLAFVGGSFGDQGGHNPYEPASHGLPVISGVRVRNFDDAYAALVDAGAAVLVADQTEFERHLVDLLRSDKGACMGKAGRNFVANREEGVTASVKLIESAQLSG